MKINCPAGCGEFDSTIVNCQSELDVHIDNNHEDSTRMLCDLLIKIHEKIEFLKKADDLQYYGIIEELKSILESESKK